MTIPFATDINIEAVSPVRERVSYRPQMLVPIDPRWARFRREWPGNELPQARPSTVRRALLDEPLLGLAARSPDAPGPSQESTDRADWMCLSGAHFGELELAPRTKRFEERIDRYDFRGFVTLTHKPDLKQAIADFNKSLETDPGLAIAFANRAITNLANGNDAEAEMDYRRSLELNKQLKPLLERCFNQVRQQRMAKETAAKP